MRELVDLKVEEKGKPLIEKIIADEGVLVFDCSEES